MIQQYVGHKNFAVLPEQNMENRMGFVRQVILQDTLYLYLLYIALLYSCIGNTEIAHSMY